MVRRWWRQWRTGCQLRGRAEKGGRQGAAGSPRWLCLRSSAAARGLSPCRCGRTESPLGGPFSPGEMPIQSSRYASRPPLSAPLRSPLEGFPAPCMQMHPVSAVSGLHL